jgi:carnitine O-acetyltransferase
LEAIETSLFVLCLDEHKPTSDSSNPEAMQDFSRQLWHGNGHNRFFDKPIQWVVFDSGESGL